jgi:dynein heavy chain
MWKKIKTYLAMPAFAIDEVKKVSKAAMSLCMWIHAMDAYVKIMLDVRPKKERLAQMNQELLTANEKLAMKQAELHTVCAFSLSLSLAIYIYRYR